MTQSSSPPTFGRHVLDVNLLVESLVLTEDFLQNDGRGVDVSGLC